MAHIATFTILNKSYPVTAFTFDKRELAEDMVTTQIPDGQIMLGLIGNGDTFLAEVMDGRTGVIGECKIVFTKESIENRIEEIKFTRGTITDYEERVERGDEYLPVGISIAAIGITIKRSA